MANSKDYNQTKQAVEPEKLNQWECVPVYAHTNIEDNFNPDRLEVPNHPQTKPVYISSESLAELIETNSRNLISGLKITQEVLN